MTRLSIYGVTSLNQAITLGIDDIKGSIKIGKDADIVIIDDACNVETTIKMENIMLSNDLSLVE